MRISSHWSRLRLQEATSLMSGFTETSLTEFKRKPDRSTGKRTPLLFYARQNTSARHISTSRTFTFRKAALNRRISICTTLIRLTNVHVRPCSNTTSGRRKWTAHIRKRIWNRSGRTVLKIPDTMRILQRRASVWRNTAALTELIFQPRLTATSSTACRTLSETD